MINILMSRSILGSSEIHHYAKRYIKNTDKVLIICFSFFEEQFNSIADYHLFYQNGGEYYQKMIDSFSPYGVTEKQIDFLNYYNDDHEIAIKKIKNADIIYLPGGAPDLMMKRIIDFNIKNALESHNKVFIGSSAGAMIQFKNYYITKDNEYQKFSYQEGLNLIEDLFIEVHYRRKKNQKRSLKKVFRSYRKDIYAIPDDGAIIIDQKQVILINTAKKLYDKNGVVK
jgi:peptidase E